MHRYYSKFVLGINFRKRTYFKGRRCEVHRQGPSLEQEKFYYAHIHYAILHTGKHRHGTIARKGFSTKYYFMVFYGELHR